MTVFDLGLVFGGAIALILEGMVPAAINIGELGVGVSGLGETLPDRGLVDARKIRVGFGPVPGLCDGSRVVGPNRVLATDPGMFERRRRKFLPTENFDSCGVLGVGVASASSFRSATPLARLADGGLAEASGALGGAFLSGVAVFFEGVAGFVDNF